jgi:hypothetical protein
MLRPADDADGALTGIPVAPEPVDSETPRRPKPDCLVYGLREAVYVMRVTVRHVQNIRGLMPPTLSSISNRPMWSKAILNKWLADGAPEWKDRDRRR